MDILQSHAALKQDFVYTSEDEDYWELWPYTGKIYDDCDGFSLNLVKRHFQGFWKPIFQKKAVLYHCQYYGVGHMVVKIDDYYCDNITYTPFKTIPAGYTNFSSYSRFAVVMNMFVFKAEWKYRFRKWVKGLFNKA